MICEACGSEFELLQGRGMHRRLMCYTCQPVNGNRKQTYRNKHLKRKYGITQKQYSDLYTKQNGECKICSVKMEFSNETPLKGISRNGKACLIDHCHSSGKVRGLLCFHCNTALGHMFDNIDNVENMLKYLKGNE